MEDERCYLVVPLKVEGSTPDHFALYARADDDEEDPTFFRLVRKVDVPEELRIESEPLFVSLADLMHMKSGGLS